MDTKKPSIAIVSHVDSGKTTMSAALITAAENERVVVIGASTVNAQQQQPFESTKKFQYKNYHPEPINGIQLSGKAARRQKRKNKRKKR